MKNLPKIPESVGRIISHWIQNPRGVSWKEVQEISKFYHSLNIKHSKSDMYYRGLSISPIGIDDVLRTYKLELHYRGVESWSCKLSTASKFTPRLKDIIRKESGGIVLAKSIPENKILFDLNKLYDTYSKVIGKTGLGVYFDSKGLIALEDIDIMDECELVTNTICTKCDYSDMVKIEFKYVESHKDIILGFLGKFKWDLKTSMRVDISYLTPGVTIHMNRKVGGSWTFLLRQS